MTVSLWAHYIASLLILLLAACTVLPAQPPPQLQYTPGPALVVQERTLYTSVYQVDPPAGWRIVKSTIASDPIVLVLVAPDDTMMMNVGEESMPAFPEDSAFVRREEMVRLPDGHTIYLTGQGKIANASHFHIAFDAVWRSIRLSE